MIWYVIISFILVIIVGGFVFDYLEKLITPCFKSNCKENFMKAIVKCPTCNSKEVYVDVDTDYEVCSKCGETGIFPLELVTDESYLKLMETLQYANLDKKHRGYL